MARLPTTATLSTVEEYLAKERESEERHEYLDGRIYLMAGESPEHGAICTNSGGQLYSQLRGGPCQVFSKDTKVCSGPIPMSRYYTKGLYSFPDLVVVCGEPQFLDEHRDVLVNPRVIIEVLSPSTEAFDRGEKFLRYRTHLDSLTDYVVVAQNRPLVEHFARQPNGQWVIAATATDLSESVVLSSIGCTLRLSEVYDRIVFAGLPDDEPTPATG
ncbi:MAG: Uma2 family endonuclease [Acidobacteriota bacterium]